MIDPFWLVWCPDGYRPPKFEHSSKLSAEKEAVRMAGKIPGKEFYVMECVGCAIRTLEEKRVRFAESRKNEESPV